MYRTRRFEMYLTMIGIGIAVAHGVRAQDTQTTTASGSIDSERPKQRGELALELGGYFRDDDDAARVVVSPLISGWISVAKGVDMELDWGLALSSIDPESASSKGSFCLGNPALSAKRVISADRNQIYFGVGVAAPVSSINAKPRELDDGKALNDWQRKFLRTQYTSRTAAAMRGLWDYWLWIPEHLSFFIPVGAKMISEEHILAAGQAAGALLIPTGDYETDRAEMIIQLAGDLGFAFEWFSAGLRVQGVLLPIPGGDEGHAQFSAGVFGRFDLNNAFVAAKAMMNLDTPYGAFDKGPEIWGVLLSGGAKF
jgi:hypothetical protein